MNWPVADSEARQFLPFALSLKLLCGSYLDVYYRIPKWPRYRFPSHCGQKLNVYAISPGGMTTSSVHSDLRYVLVIQTRHPIPDDEINILTATIVVTEIFNSTLIM